MAGYDTGSLTLSSMTAAPNDILRLTAPNNGQQTLGGGMDAFDHDLNFEGEGLLYVHYTQPIPTVKACLN